jgi:propanol-preferring alcohol dehydrogenase
MAKTMKAAVVTAFDKPLSIEEVPVPEVGPDQVLMKVEVCGVCGTDVSAARGSWPIKPTPPFIPGHEGVGHVAAVGRDVKDVKEGDRIGVPFMYSACGHCEFCTTGWEPLCPQMLMTGYLVNGGFAEYALGHPTYVTHIPDALELAPAAPIMCAGVTVYKGLKMTETRPGHWVLVSGIGGLGHLAVQYAKAMGMHCVAVDVSPQKVALGKEMGADLVINAAEEDPVARVQQEIGGVHGAIVTAASVPAFAQAVGMMRRHGTLSLIGIAESDLPLNPFLTVAQGITVRGSIVGNRQDMVEAMQFAAEGKVSPHYSTAKLDDVNTIIENLESGKVDGRVVMQIG